MGRRRRVERDEIIDAVGFVIREHGWESLSIEAVARAAGIGKTSVLYDFKSKDALLAAFVERKIRLHRDAVAALRTGYAAGPDATMHAFIDYIRSPASQDDLGSGMLVAAAASGNESFRRFLEETFSEEVSTVEAEASKPDRALLAYLALHGLLSLECFGFCRLGGDKRARALDEIARLISAEPAAAADAACNEAEFSEYVHKSPQYSRKSPQDSRKSPQDSRKSKVIP